MAFLLNNDHHPIKPTLSPTYSWSMVVIYYVIPIEIQYLFEQKLKVPRLCSYHLVIKRGWLENPYQRIQKDVYTWENHRQIVDSPASSEYWRVCVFFFSVKSLGTQIFKIVNTWQCVKTLYPW